jgi:hypothetical protein
MIEHRRTSCDNAARSELSPLIVYGAIEVVAGTAPDGIGKLAFLHVPRARLGMTAWLVKKRFNTGCASACRALII